MGWRTGGKVTGGGLPKGRVFCAASVASAHAVAKRREVRRYLQMRMAMLVSTEVTESQVEMARTELSLLVD